MVDKLYESENFLVVNKPFDMYINSDDENEKNTVTCHIASPDSHLASSASPLHFVQRLDYSTSGVLCIAKNKNAAARACKLFEKRDTSKYYLAIVRGHLDFELGDIMFDVGESLDASGHRMCAVSSSDSACSGPRAAHTRILLLETGRFMKDPVSVVLLKPVTGRRHQLRVHCAAAGHTVLGDYTYSRAADTAPQRMFLHATRLVLPLQAEPLDIQTSEPFFTHAQLTAHYRPERTLHKFRTRDEFRKACDLIDTSYLIGVKYKRFCL